MKFKSLFLILSSSLILISLVSCGKDNSKSKNSASTDDKSSGEVNTLTTSSKRSYQFIVNGCDTGKREFTSDSPENTKKLMCEALQNNSLNNYCAWYSREDFFYTACEGQSWNPY